MSGAGNATRLIKKYVLIFALLQMAQLISAPATPAGTSMKGSKEATPAAIYAASSKTKVRVAFILLRL